jgi:uncharacterized protein (DUF1499 family)
MKTYTALLKSVAAGLIILLMNNPAPADTSVTRLPPCPETPNCVSSQAADAAHFIDPIPYSGTPVSALERLTSVLATLPRMTITAEQGHYLHAEARSLVFRFVDDVEFLLDTDRQLIHVRSASRSGYSDLGVNRRRVESIRTAFLKTP